MSGSSSSVSPVVISVVGNIASSKTSVLDTLLEQLREQLPGVEVTKCVEPIDEWTAKRAGNCPSALEMSYRLPYGSSFPFQVQVLSWQNEVAEDTGRKARQPGECSMVDFGEHSCCFLTQEGTVSACRPRILLMERSTDDGATFVEVKASQGDFSGVAVDAYNRLLEQGMGIVPDLVVYLKTSPEDCHKRKQRRDREGEKGVSLEYLSELHERYETLHSKYTNAADTRDNTLVLTPEDQETLADIEKEKTRLATRVVEFLRERPHKLVYRNSFPVDGPPEGEGTPFPYDADLPAQKKREREEKDTAGLLGAF